MSEHKKPPHQKQHDGLMRRHYSIDYTIDAEDSSVLERQQLITTLEKVVSGILKEKQKAIILDVGSGRQILEKELMDFSDKIRSFIQEGKVIIVSLDIADLTSRQLLTNLPHVQGNAHHLPFTTESMDLIVSNMAIDFADHQQAFSEVLRVLKNDGYFIGNFHHPDLIVSNHEIAINNIKRLDNRLKKAKKQLRKQVRAIKKQYPTLQVDENWIPKNKADINQLQSKLVAANLPEKLVISLLKKITKVLERLRDLTAFEFRARNLENTIFKDIGEIRTFFSSLRSTHKRNTSRFKVVSLTEESGTDPETQAKEKWFAIQLQKVHVQDEKTVLT